MSACARQLTISSVNIANAKVFYLSEDLGLVGNQYNTALVIFFVPYILFEIPSNVILKKLKPRIWLSLCMFGFGLVTLLQGFVQNYSGLLATRFFLGLTEAGMFVSTLFKSAGPMSHTNLKSREASICCLAGFVAMRLRSGTRFSSPRRLWLAPLEVCLPVPSARWMAWQDTEDGGKARLHPSSSHG